MKTLEDRVVATVHAQFAKLPAKSKPRNVIAGDVAEWVPLAGIAICKEDGSVQCVALGTGMKCIDIMKIGLANGNILHDSHAETLALRAFNHFLLNECHRLTLSKRAVSDVIQPKVGYECAPSSRQQPFTVREGVRIFMYCSEAPCGDASMELVMQAQKDTTPWPVTQRSLGDEQHGATLLGRGSFSELGVVRRKPARADAITSLSKSCSDKLAMKQCTSFLSGLASLLISPENAFLDTLILPKDQYASEACERAFGPTGRMAPVSGKDRPSGYAFLPFTVASTDHDLYISRKSALNKSDTIKGSNVSAVWTPYAQETLINGVLQGRKQGDPKGASMLSRRKLAELTCTVAASCRIPEVEDVALCNSYRAIKNSLRLSGRRLVKGDVTKEALEGWVKNVEDDFNM
ncbi:MAG: hypothetical protein Q9217_006201 [Psora testacea]